MHPTFAKLAFAALAAFASASALAAPTYPATESFGVPVSKDEPWYQECMRVEHVSGVEQPAGQAQGPQSDASKLYYQKRSQAVTSQAEWNAVREHALADGDNAVLMMLYANGFGVARNTDIAIHYACSMNFVAKAEMEYRVAHLAKVESSSATFDQCDDITSGMMSSVCADIHETQAQHMREARLDRVARTLPDAARPAFKRLRASAETYANAAWQEVDGHGTGAAGFATERQAKLREQFMQAVLDLVDHKLSAPPPSDTMRLDQELNTLYQKLMSAPSSQADEPNRLGESTVERTKLRQIERLWLAYRDAFLAFAAKLPSGPAPHTVESLLISQRIGELTKVAAYL